MLAALFTRAALASEPSPDPREEGVALVWALAEGSTATPAERAAPTGLLVPAETAIARLTRLGPRVPAPATLAPNPFESPMAPTLHPVRVQYLRRTFEQADAALAGPRASSIYRAPLSQLDVAFQMQSYNLPTEPFDDTFEWRTLGLLAVAMSSAAQDVLTDALRDAPLLAAGQTVIRTLTTPSFSVNRTGDGRTSVTAQAVGPRQAGLTAAQLDQEASAGRTRATGAFRAGAGLQLQTIDDDEETPLVDGAVWVVAQNVGVDAWRVSGLAFTQSWSASARQHVVGPWHLTASTRSLSESALPAVWQAGTLTELPGPWQVRTWYRRTLPAVAIEEQETEVGLEVRALWRWRAPQPVDGWGLGNRVDREGLAVPGSDYLEEHALAAGTSTP